MIPASKRRESTLVKLFACAVLALLVSGCAESRKPASEGAQDPVLIAALGDSITAGSPYWDPDPAVRERIGPDVDPDSQFPLWAQVRLGRGFAVRNCGVFGERTDQIAARLTRAHAVRGR